MGLSNYTPVNDTADLAAALNEYRDALAATDLPAELVDQIVLSAADAMHRGALVVATEPAV